MPDSRHSSPTRSVYLELKEERDLIREGYEFLDEKRMLLAQEMLRRLHQWRVLRDDYRTLYTQAVAALAAALARHGLDGLMVYPRAALTEWSPSLVTHRFLGVELLESDSAGIPIEPAAAPVLVTPEAEHCRAQHAALIGLSARLAAAHASLERLIAEYVRTERRARALENVLLPEIERTLRFVDGQLEGIDQEEVLRARFSGRHRAV